MAKSHHEERGGKAPLDREVSLMLSASSLGSTWQNASEEGTHPAAAVGARRCPWPTHGTSPPSDIGVSSVKIKLSRWTGNNTVLNYVLRTTHTGFMGRGVSILLQSHELCPESFEP